MTPPTDRRTLAVNPPSGRMVRMAAACAAGVRRMLCARPVPLPVPARRLSRLDAVERAAEVLRYSLACAEHWLSPGGILRAVLRVSILLSLLIGLPTLIVGLIVLLFLQGAAAASAALASLAANLAAMSVSLISAVIGFTVLTALLRHLLRRK